MKTDQSRDLRLDFFRGLSLYIIFVAHVHDNILWDILPARFGFSDSADLFVFVSGYASGIAFGGTFAKIGFRAGLTRVAMRCWQLYLAHLLLFVALVAIAGWASAVLPTQNYIAQLHLERLIEAPLAAIGALFLFEYMPAYIDILPLYIAMLAAIPLLMLVARLDRRLVLAIIVAVYTLNFATFLLTGAGIGPRSWQTYTPFAWQLLFFGGFCLSRGWLKAPRVTAWLVGLAAILVIAALVIKLTLPPGSALLPFIDKQNLGPLRVIHFAALAIITTALLQRLPNLASFRLARPLIASGQQGLTLFLSGVILAELGGIAFDAFGTGLVQQIVVNFAGFAGLYGASRLVGHFKATPWIKRPAIHLSPVSLDGQRHFGLPRGEPPVNFNPDLTPAA